SRPAGHCPCDFQLRSTGMTTSVVAVLASGRQNTGSAPSCRQTLPLRVTSISQGSGSVAIVAPRVTPASPVRALRSVPRAARVAPRLLPPVPAEGGALYGP